jgi:hypothetical protein
VQAIGEFCERCSVSPGDPRVRLADLQYDRDRQSGQDLTSAYIPAAAAGSSTRHEQQQSDNSLRRCVGSGSDGETSGSDAVFSARGEGVETYAGGDHDGSTTSSSGSSSQSQHAHQSEQGNADQGADGLQLVGPQDALVTTFMAYKRMILWDAVLNAQALHSEDVDLLAAGSVDEHMRVGHDAHDPVRLEAPPADFVLPDL